MLKSDTVNVDGAGAIADSGITATGVESITVTFQNLNDPGIGRKIDIFGTATVIPEPATLGLISAFGGGILLIRRSFMI